MKRGDRKNKKTAELTKRNAIGIERGEGPISMRSERSFDLGLQVQVDFWKGELGKGKERRGGVHSGLKEFLRTTFGDQRSDLRCTREEGSWRVVHWEILRHSPLQFFVWGCVEESELGNYYHGLEMVWQGRELMWSYWVWRWGSRCGQGAVQGIIHKLSKLIWCESWSGCEALSCLTSDHRMELSIK